MVACVYSKLLKTHIIQRSFSLSKKKQHNKKSYSRQIHLKRRQFGSAQIKGGLYVLRGNDSLIYVKFHFKFIFNCFSTHLANIDSYF